MSSLKAIRKRITSVKNTQKITRAMKLVAAARLRRAQEAITAARPYAESLEQVIADLAARTDREAHELLADREGTRTELVALTSDRGLAGSFNAQITRHIEGMLTGELADADSVSLRLVGKKGNEYFKRRDVEIESYDSAPSSAEALEGSRNMARRLVDDFLEGKFDRVLLVFNRFRSAISQDVTVKQLLPVVPAELDEESRGDFLYEPSQAEVLDHLLPLYIETQLYRATLESIASELGSRMSAMDGATRNAGEMIDKLSLEYNRARQAAITTELLEITSGAESLKG